MSEVTVSISLTKKEQGALYMAHLDAKKTIKVLTAERDAFRSVLSGAGYNNLEALGGMSADTCQMIGEDAKESTLRIIGQRDELLAVLQAFERISDIWLPAEVEEGFAEEMFVLHKARNDMLAAIAKATE